MPSYRRRGGSLLTYVAVAAAAAGVGLLIGRRGVQPQGEDAGRGGKRGLAAISPGAAADADAHPGSDYVRPAGPEAMRDPPRRGWDMLDEAADESFPASDPPGNY